MYNNIQSIFKDLSLPSTSNFKCEKFNKSNLWIVKDDNGNCGIFIDNVNDTSIIDDKMYKNLLIKKYKKLETEGIILNDIFMVTHNDTIIPGVFSESLNSYFNVNPKKQYSLVDIKDALNQIEAITKNKKEKLNEIIGVWGELYILKLFLDNTPEDKHHNIVNGWESPNGRALIDIKLNKIKLFIEVKTTTLDSRIHHISSINQLKCTDGFQGFLASICIKEESGFSCSDLVSEISNTLNDNNKFIFNQRVKVRGENLCFNNKYSFNLNKEKKINFFDFEDLPIPIITDEILKINWDMILENLSFLDETELINKIKF